METKEGSVPPVERAGGDGKRTAILVIHGIGEQNPFDTLDGFVCGLHKFLKTKKAKSTVSHIIKKREAVGGGNWTESFIQLDADTPDRAYRIDVHECYWADLTEKKISEEEVYSWMLRTLWGVGRFLKVIWANRKAHPKKLKVAVSHMLLGIYLLIFGYSFLFLIFLILVTASYYGFFGPKYLLIDLINTYWTHGSAGLAIVFGLSRFKPLVSILSVAGKGLKKKYGMFLTGYIGDVAIYTTTDEKSSHFQLRQQILARTQTLLENILFDAKYNRVIVAGHSLGSVVGYDVLNRINIKANLEPVALPVHKIAGFITFGSPLDKVALFFGQHAAKNQTVRRQIMEQLYSFRAVQLDSAWNPFKVKNPIEQKLDTSRTPLAPFPWVNYWSSLDPISGHLDFYKPLENVHLDVHACWGYAHVKYWETNAMYEDIVGRFFHDVSWAAVRR